jgi:mRNA-degrading endonuclease RelE of RelBE toxin-antitoxin system
VSDESGAIGGGRHGSGNTSYHIGEHKVMVDVHDGEMVIIAIEVVHRSWVSGWAGA